MTLTQSILAALGAKYEESKPVIDSELIEYATDKQIESLAKWDALSREGNKMAGAFALALRLKLAKAMEAAHTEDARAAAETEAEPPKRQRARAVKK